MDLPKVLIVEDNKINALVLTKAIQAYCHPVHVVSDDQAFAAVEEHGFQAIFMDINLGSNSLDGEAIMKRLKQDARFAKMPIFAITSYAMPEDRVRFLNAGFDAYFSKPIEKEKIIAKLQAVLKQVNV